MYPTLFHIGSFAFKTYSLMAVLAMFAAMICVRAEAKRFGWNVRSASWLVVQCTIIGFVGAHVLYALTRWDLPSPQWWHLLIWRIGYGNVWFGGLLAGWAWCFYYARSRQINQFKLYDVIALAAMPALAVGRIGCFFNGCCYGKPTELPWGITLNYTREFGQTPVTLHPVPLYEMIYLLGLFALLWRARTRTTYEGQTLVRYLFFAASGRFALEFLRGDTIRGSIFGIVSTSQLIALVLISASLLLHQKLKKA